MKNFFEDATIICLDGLDCSGKETISGIIENSKEINSKYDFVRTLSFPNYYNMISVSDMISNLLNPDVYKFHTDGVLADSDFNRILFEARMFYYNIYNGLMTNNTYLYERTNCDNSKRRLFIMDRYWQSNVFYQTSRYLLMQYGGKIADKREFNESLNDISRALLSEANKFNFPQVNKYFYIKMPIEFIEHFLSKKKNKDANELDMQYIKYTKAIYDNHLDLIQTCDDNIKTYTIDAEYERTIHERVEYAPEVVKAFTDKKDGRFVYAVSVDKSYQKLKSTKELAEEIIKEILKEEE